MKNRIFFSLLFCGVILLLAAACSKQEDIIPAEGNLYDIAFMCNHQTLEVKDGNLDYDEVLAGLDCDMSEGDILHIKIAQVLGEEEEEAPEAEEYFLDLLVLADGEVASSLIQMYKGDYEITLFEIGSFYTEGEEQVFKPHMATPMDSSSFASFVSETLPIEFTVGDYTNDQIQVDVLCFSEPLIPAFGFTWWDYSEIEGDKFCLYVTCLNQDISAMQQNVPARISAHMIRDKETSRFPYWTERNYDPDDEASLPAIQPVCIPLPDVIQNLEDGVSIRIIPKGNWFWEYVEINVTQEMLNALTDPEVKAPENAKDENGNEFIIKDLLEGGELKARFLHIVLASCPDSE